jgi:hypothetical protein
VLIAELIRTDGILVPTGKRMVPVTEVGAVSLNAKLVEPGCAEFCFKTFTKVSLGLWIQVNATCDFHNIFGSLRFRLSGLGCRNEREGGMAARTSLRFDSGRLAGSCGRVGGTDNALSSSSQ